MSDRPSPGSAVVIGASGLLGRAVCRYLVREGWQVTGVCRHPPVAGRPEDEEFPPVEWVAADRRQEGILDPLLSRGPRLVVDLALHGPDEALSLVRAWVPGGPTRFVATGTVGEEGVHRPLAGPLPEGASPDPDDDPHSLGCVDAWRVLAQARAQRGFPFAWAVLPRLWGPGDRSGRDAAWIGAILDGLPVLLRGDGRARLPDGSSAAAAAAVVAGGTLPQLEGRRYHACGPSGTLALALVGAAADALGRSARVALVPPQAWAEFERARGCRVDPALPDRDLVLERTALDAAGIGTDSSPEAGMAEAARFVARHRDSVPPGPGAPPEVIASLARAGRILEAGGR